jgi:putative CocE/NonD family hydrolase
MDDDQRFASARSDVLSFKTDTLTEDLVLAGPLVADLQVSISTTDADFVVKLIDVFPENNKGQGRYRDGFDKPKAFIPAQVTEIKYTLNDIAHRFKKGHRIMVQVQSSWFPLADRNPQQMIDIYHATPSEFVRSTIKIFMSSAKASRIILPVLKD